MVIDYTKEALSEFPNFKGGEKHLDAHMFFDGKVRILNAQLVPGASIGLHRHDTNAEIMFITGGSGLAICDGVEEPVHAGCCHYCPKGSEHTLINNGTDILTFFAAVPEMA